MPEISRFFGIVIKMFFDDHNPPHFHAEYGKDKAIININDLKIQSGRLSPRVMGLIIEWAVIHRSELLLNWKISQTGKSLKKIKPLK